MPSKVLACIGAIGIPICAVIAVYIVVSMVMPTWPISNWAIGFLTSLGFVSSGWAAFRLKKRLNAPFSVVALAAILLAVAHFSVKRAFFLASTNLSDYPFYLSVEMVMLAVVVTLPFTLFSGWLGARLAARSFPLFAPTKTPEQNSKK